MGRPNNLTVETTSTLPLQARTPVRAVVAHKSVSSLSSMTQDEDAITPTTTTKPTPLPTPTEKPPQASLGLLFSLFSKKDMVSLVLPAVIASLASASIPPFMSIVVGDAYDVFSAYQSTATPTAHDNYLLLKGIGLSGIEFCAMAGGALFLSGVMSSLWVWVGEKNVMYLRRMVYVSVSDKEMEWYDRNTEEKGGDGAVGAGGLMTQFASATEDVRIATGLNMGFMIQHICAIIATTVMAFVRSPLLTVVILSTIPVLMVITAIAQIFGFKFYGLERQRTNSASTMIDRAITSISTVKAFNAQGLESARISFSLDLVRAAAMKCQAVWAVNSGFGNFVIFSMFVQGFWFGAKLVRDGKLSAGDVLAVFWACLIAASTLMNVVTCLGAFNRGKSSMVTLVALARPTPSSSKNNHDSDNRPMSGYDRMSLQPIVKTPKSAFFSRTSIVKAIPLQKIRPTNCQGEFQFTNLSFAYPSRPEVPVLSDVSMFLPAGEMTFIVGGSGSGKSTVAQLLLRLYAPQDGSIELDGKSFDYLDENWTRGQVAAVTQGHVLFDGTVHENVALGVAGGLSGRHPRDVTRQEVIDACRVALMHDFVRDLPEGYDTKLGNGGAALSGGQKQRLSIARAYLRDPTVLILDEATSALDGTSRLLVFEAIKHWRKNKTTIVITHDLSQIGPEDFVYVLKHGSLVEQGFRSDLEVDTSGEFHSMAVTQGMTGGFLPPKDNELEEDNMVYERDYLVEEVEHEREEKLGIERKHLSAFANPTLPQGGTWLDPSVQQHGDPRGRLSPLYNGKTVANALPYHRPASRQEFDSPETRLRNSALPRRRSLTIAIPDKQTEAWRRSSLQITPSTATSTSFDDEEEEEGGATVMDDEDFEGIKQAMQATSAEAQRRRVNSSRRRWDATPAETNPAHRDQKRLRRLRSKPKMRKTKSNANGFSEKPTFESVEPVEELPIVSPAAEDRPHIGFFKLAWIYWRTLPHKLGYILGLIFAVLSGICTPIFGYFLSQLVVSITTSRVGFRDTGMITQHGIYVLALAIGSGLATGIKYWLIEWVSMDWLRKVRKGAFENIVQQDKEWFDLPNNTPSQVLQLIMRDPEDGKAFISVVVPQAIVVTSMIGTGLIWALVQGWQLTLVGLALGPIFIGFSSLQNHWAGKFERRNKQKREDVNKMYYDSVANVRAIRSMGFNKIFKEHFERSLESAMKSGVDGGFVDGLAFGIANALIYLAQGLIYYVGAVLIAKGTYSFLQMIQVLNLVAFTLAIAAQMLQFVQRIHKSLHALRDFERLLNLKTIDTNESQGKNRWRVQGPIRFHNVSFAYPTRPTATVLRNLSLKIKPNESVALVGASGSGKSTIAALLQRLYQPTDGFISVNGHRLQNSDVVWLREHMAVVSQAPQLFDSSIEENIGYGGSNIVPHADIERAAKEANIHDFIMSLPDGYDTYVGENASLISGGQAQRICIARALVRRASILILDECTSALDAENQAQVMNTIQRAKNGRTTLIVTHKLPLMQMADRIVVMEDGGVAEEGTYDDLMRKRGVFYKLATAGEWEGASE